MKRTLLRLTMALATFTIAAAGVVVLGSPAQAAPCGSSQKKEFPTSGYNTDISIKLCVTQTSEGKVRATADGYWTDGGGVRKFDNFDLQVRLEGEGGVNILKTTCDYTSEINGLSSGGFQCHTTWLEPATARGLTADGTVYYDLDADGKGGYSWGLQGTPAA
jgi:hypothetical protein